MASESSDQPDKKAIDKFVTRDPQKSTDEAVQRALKRIRGQFTFTDADLRRLGRPRRRRAL